MRPRGWGYEVIVFVPNRNEAKTRGFRHGIERDAPIGTMLRHGCGNGVVIARLNRVSGWPFPVQRLIDQATDLDLDAGLAAELEASVRVFDTHDMLEGARAFLEKRDPDYRGR